MSKIPKIILVEDYEEMSRCCAGLVKDWVSRKPDCLLCFPAGSTAVRTFEVIREMYDKKEIDFSKTKFVALDEWLDLPQELEGENCTSFMKKNLYDALNISPERLVLFDVHAKDYEAECKRVDQFIFDHGGIDFMLLGLGMNGHLGLNEPGGSFEDYAKVVALSETTKTVGQKYFSKPVSLTRGITLGMKHVRAASQVVLQVSGGHKKDIVHDLYHSPVTEKLPASVFHELNGGLIVLDEASAARVEYSIYM